MFLLRWLRDWWNTPEIKCTLEQAIAISRQEMCERTKEWFDWENLTVEPFIYPFYHIMIPSKEPAGEPLEIRFHCIYGWGEVKMVTSWLEFYPRKVMDEPR